jgi:ABC-type nitrate/sulfonate/bicarbonate transport system substrate-binding protein
MRRRRVLAYAASPSLAALASVACTPTHAQAPAASRTTLRVVAFAGGWNLPLWAAEREGFFARHGVAVELAYTPGSAALVEGLMAGRHDIALAAIDNLIAYQEGQGEGPPLRDPDLVAVMGVDNGFLSVVAQGSIATIAELRGRKVAVDSPSTGFAFVLRELLQREGVDERDVTVVRGGATELRYAGLLAGAYDATLLRTPFEVLAAERGFRVLARADALGPYLGTSGFVRRSWASANEAALVGFLRAYREAMRWLVDPAHRDAAAALLVANVRGMTPALALRAADVLLAERGGLLRDLEIEPAALATVLKLRAKYGRPERTLGDAARYVDPTYRAKAIAGAR